MDHLGSRAPVALSGTARLLAVAAIGTLVWCFIEVADEVISGESHRVDNWVLDLLRNPQDRGLPRGPMWMVDAARDITALGSPAVLSVVVAIATGCLWLARKRVARCSWLRRSRAG